MTTKGSRCGKPCDRPLLNEACMGGACVRPDDHATASLDEEHYCEVCYAEV